MNLEQLTDFGISPHTGFFPAEHSAAPLLEEFAAWERLAKGAPELLAAGTFRKMAAALPAFESKYTFEEPALRRAMLVLSMIGQAWVHGAGTPARRLPANISVPWCAVAETLGRPPVIAHASLVLDNCRKIDPALPCEPENLRSEFTFSGTEDENWFYAVTAAIEAEGGPAIQCLLELQKSAAEGSPKGLVDSLKRLEMVLNRLRRTLRRMREKCAPAIFYRQIRPWLDGWLAHGLVYEGVSESPKKYAGGSAAQSTLLQTLDCVLGVRHAPGGPCEFLQEMQSYMPAAHRDFLRQLAADRAVREIALEIAGESPAVPDAYNRCVSALASFRKTHTNIVRRYILGEAEDIPSATGTGGTHALAFLEATHAATEGARVRGGRR